ncbi:hypothetical protein K440DRAFT_331684 [Wilcoxina mikolae CBS 423.85]|nr:hypothetical protein K440DRAFT_331684 [Wilcoxina mikolae CBS 423.85]
MNLHTIESLKDGIGKFQSQSNSAHPYAEVAAFGRFMASVDGTIKRMRQHRERVLGLTQRCDSLAALVPCMLASLDNTVMLDMQEQAARYTRSMRIVTVVAMFFLPPSLIAGFFGTDLIKGTPLASQESGMKWFWGCVAVLMVITFGLWLLYQHFDDKYRKKSRQYPDIEAG